MHIQRLITLTGWRRRGLLIVLGACAALALPPFYALPLLIPAFAGLFLFVHYTSTPKQAFFTGWWWGLGHFTVGLYWTCISMWIEPEKFAWLTPFALLGLPSILSIYIGLVTWLLYCISRKWARMTGENAILIFAALWVGTEYLRAHLFTGFPWNLIGYVWTVSGSTLQLASVGGIYGLSWLTVLIATQPALFVTEDVPKAKLPNYIACALLVAMTAFGMWRLESHPTEYTHTKMRLVQANIPQTLKWDPKETLNALKSYVRLTRTAGLDSVNLVIWPETAVPYYLQPENELTHDLGTLLPDNALLITGGLRGGNNYASTLWNSVFAINTNGLIIAEYDKHHLVPFGEYMPFRSLVPGVVKAIAGEMGDFERGPGPQTLSIDPYPPVSPLLCYEAIFPDEVVDTTLPPQWLLSLTDDAWFGYSSEPFQAMEMARTRAVEQGIPLVRVSNNGVSAVFDAYGRQLGQLPFGKEGILDAYLPVAIAQTSIFSRYPFFLILLIIASGSIFLIWHGKKHVASL